MSKWWKLTKIPVENKNFQKILIGYLFECPSATKKNYKGSKTTYTYVSCRKNSFRERNINGQLLRNLNNEIKKRVNKMYICSRNIEENLDELISKKYQESGYSDPNIELIAFKANSSMTDTENIYYCIRNALAHGSFQVINGNPKIYIFESNKDGKLKSRIRLKEDTLLYFIKLSKLDAKKVRELNKK